MRGAVMTVTQEMVAEECCNCGVMFAITAEMKERLVLKKTEFYCPNGHPQHYLGESDSAKAKRLERELAEAKTLQKAIQESCNDAWRQADEERRQRQQVEKARKLAERRAAAAVCPAGCHRQIQQMKRHLETKHPGWVAEHMDP